MINLESTFGRDLLQITIRNRKSNIEKHGIQNDGLGILATFEINRHALIPIG